jgi:hypothetical protein
VRSLVFDQLTDQEVDALESALGKVLARLNPPVEVSDPQSVTALRARSLVARP